MDPFTSLAGALAADGVRYVVIGVWGANYYAPSGSAMFTTLARDLFLPADPVNLLTAWCVCERSGFGLYAREAPLDIPRDAALAREVVDRRVLIRASDGAGTDVDLSLVMSGFDFETVWSARRMFEIEGVAIPVARLAHIVESKARTGSSSRPTERSSNRSCPTTSRAPDTFPPRRPLHLVTVGAQSHGSIPGNRARPRPGGGEGLLMAR